MHKFSKTETYFQFEIFCYKNDSMTREISKTGWFALDEAFLLTSLLKKIPCAVCFDIGANIGLHSLIMSKHSEKVYSFEPQITTFEVLKKNLDSNRILNCNIYNFGLSDTVTEKTLYIDMENNGASTIDKKLLNNTLFRTEQITLKIGDQVVRDFNSQKVDVIKIDVEGSETEVLLGLKETILHNKPIILLEWNNNKTREGFRRHSILDNIFQGYHAFSWSTPLQRYNIKTKRKWFRGLYRNLFQRSSKAYSIRKERFDWDTDYACVVFCPNNKLSLLDKIMDEIKLPNKRYSRIFGMLFGARFPH